MTDPTGVAVKFTYDTSGNRTESQIDPTGLNVYKTYGYDAVGNIASVKNARGNLTGYQYDADRRVIQITGPVGTCSPTTSAITQNIWTGSLVTKVRKAAVCNPNFSTDANWQVWLKSYTATDKINIETDPDAGTVQTGYDPVDRVQSVTQSIGGGQAARVTYTQYDAAGQVYRTYKAWGTSDQITYGEYQYSNDGRLISTKDANQNLTTLDYDGYGRLTETIMPGSAANASAPCHLTYTAGDNCELYGHDNNGNVTSKRNRSGQAIAMLFDALNRETSRTAPANTAGNYTRTLTTTYDLASRKWAVTADGQTLQHGYDTAARLTSVNDSLLNALGVNVGNVAYNYDAASNRTLVNFTAAAGAWGATYNYDAGERLSSITNGSSTFALYGYDPLSRMSTTSYLDSTSVGYLYEANDDVQSITHNFNGGSLQLGYTHNGVHQILTNSISDSRYMMKEVGPTTGYTENTLNQYNVVGSSTMAYDANGNLTGDGVWTYSYDEENRLRQATGNGTTAVYAYDPLGRRRSKTVNGTTTYFISDGANELAELGSTGTRLRFYVNANGMDNRVGMYDDGLGAWRIYHTNHQGSVLFTTAYATSGTILDQYHYGAYGEPPSGDSATGNLFRYTGRYLDAETGLYYYRARYYSTKLGRFLQTDPIGTKDDLDLYTYVGNDPLDKTDPTGTVIEVVGSDEFKKKIAADLAKIEEGKGGKALIGKLEATKNVIKITEDTKHEGNSTSPSSGKSANGKGTGSTVAFDPEKNTGGKDAKGSTERPAYVGLGHELGHARAMDTGQQSYDKGTGKPGTTPPSEVHSVANENMIREEHRLPTRPSYYDQ